MFVRAKLYVKSGPLPMAIHYICTSKLYFTETPFDPKISPTRKANIMGLMDYLKTRAPFWKQVEKPGGETSDKIWVEARASDDTAAERWKPAPTKREPAN